MLESSQNNGKNAIIAVAKSAQAPFPVAAKITMVAALPDLDDDDRLVVAGFHLGYAPRVNSAR